MGRSEEDVRDDMKGTALVVHHVHGIRNFVRDVQIDQHSYLVTAAMDLVSLSLPSSPRPLCSWFLSTRPGLALTNLACFLLLLKPPIFACTPLTLTFLPSRVNES